jgi:hypothetical protein
MVFFDSIREINLSTINLEIKEGEKNKDILNEAET